MAAVRCVLLLLLGCARGGCDRAAAVSAAEPPPHGRRAWLAVDPSFSLSSGLRVALANVTKEIANPLLRPEHPWEVNLGYVTVLYNPASGKYLAYVAGALCCNGGPPGGPPRGWDGDCHNDSVHLALDAGAGGAAAAPAAPAPKNCTCYAGTQFLCEPVACALGGPSPAPSSAACVARCLASLAKDPLNGCSATSYGGGQCQMQHSPFARPMAKPGSTGCQCSGQDKPRQPLREVLYCSADGTGSSPPLQGVYTIPGKRRRAGG